MVKLTKKQAIIHNRPGVNGRYYQLPGINGGTTIAHAIFSGEHGQRTIGKRARIYYILKGNARFNVNQEEFEAAEDDFI